MQAGHIYVLRNPLLPPDCVKIGLTRKSPEHRAAALSRMAAIPAPFEIAFSCPVSNVSQAERRLHLVLDDKRISSAKEFFRVSPKTAQALAGEIAAFEAEDCTFAKNLYLSHAILGASYRPQPTLRNRKILYGMIAATVNNSAFEKISRNRRTVVDGFFSIQQVADYLCVQKKTAADALRSFSKLGTQIECHPVANPPISPVFEMVRYRHGHATWRFSDAYRKHIYDPEV